MCVGLLREADLIRAAAHGVGNVLLCVGAPNRSRRHPRRELRLGGAEREERGAPAAGPGGRPVHREAAARGQPGAHHLRADRGHPGHGRGGPHQLERRDGRARRRRGRDRHRPRADPRGRDDAVRDPALRIAGAHAGRGRAATACPRCSAVCAKWELDADPDRPGDRRRHLPGAPPRAGGRRDPGPAAGGRLPDLRSRGARRRGREAPGVPPPAASPPRPTSRRRSPCCSTRPPSRASAGCTSSTIPPCRRHACSAPAETRASCGSRGTTFGLAVTVDCNNRLVALDPYEGGKATVAEAARNIACTGARAARHHRLPQLRQPGEARGVLPVPRGLPGHRRRVPRVRHAGHRRQRELLQRESRRAPSIRRPPWDGRPARAGGGAGAEPLLGAGRRDPHPGHDERASSGGSAYWAEVYDFIGGRPARVDLEAERRCSVCSCAGAARRLFRSAHDCFGGRTGRRAGGSGPRRRLRPGRPRRLGGPHGAGRGGAGRRACCTARTAPGRSCR